MLTDSPYVNALLVDPVAAVVICDLRDAGIITADQARLAWLRIATGTVGEYG